ncbi:MAG: hypothetical protein NZ992_00030 [Candidatus Korarchaeum sp.]|nr:hypothetical protein [Candidatus Korarchaeum sp.]MDW8093354.1 hypothetical protein [Nitrososphaerota archaeon]
MGIADVIASCDVSMLYKFAKHSDASVRAMVARRKDCPPDLLAQLAKDLNLYVKVEVAKRRDCPPELLAQLAEDEYIYVRTEVAANPSTPPEVLEKLVETGDPEVLCLVAKNPNTPKELQMKLLKSNIPSVKKYLALNPRQVYEVHKALARESMRKGYNEVKTLLALNTPYQDVLFDLLSDKNDGVKKKIMWNPNSHPLFIVIAAMKLNSDLRAEEVVRLYNRNARTPRERRIIDVLIALLR